MTLPIDIISRPVAWTAIRRTAVLLRRDVKNLRDLSAAGDTGRQAYLDLQHSLKEGVDTLNLNAAVPNLAAYVTNEVPGYTGDLQADFIATRDAASTLQTWIFDNYPRSGGADSTSTTDLNGNTTELTLTTAQTATFRTAADTFLATLPAV